jgi:plastocyanin
LAATNQLSLKKGLCKRSNPAQAPLAAPQNEVKITFTEFKFSSPSQRISAGQPITLILDNAEAESQHAIFFPGLGVLLFAYAGEIVRKIVVFDKAGEFTYVCDLPGHREAGMIGKLTVRAGDNGNSPEIVLDHEVTPWPRGAGVPVKRGLNPAETGIQKRATLQNPGS